LDAGNKTGADLDAGKKTGADNEDGADLDKTDNDTGAGDVIGTGLDKTDNETGADLSADSDDETGCRFVFQTQD